MGYGGIDFDSVDVSKLDEQVASSGQKLEEKRTEEDKSIWDKAKETAGAVYDTVANEAEYVAGVVENTVQDMTAARDAVVEGWSNWQHQGAKLQEKAFKGELTEDDVNALKQAGTDLTDSAWKAGLSPVRQVAREVISHTADNPESPFQPIGQSIQQTKANLQYFMTSEEKAQKAREIEREVGIPADIIITDDDAYKAALDVYNFKQKNEDIENVWKEYPELWNIGDMDSQAIALALHNINDVRTTHGIVDSFTHFIQQGNIKLEYDNLQYKIMSGEADDNDRQRAKDLRLMMDMDKKKAPSFFDDPAAAMAAGVAQSLPEMGQGIKEGAETALPSMVAAALFTVATGGTGAVAVGGAAGMAALRAALMRAIGSQGVKQVGKYAFQLGMFRGMQKPESGSRYEELGELKDKDGKTLLTDDERRGWAMLGGSANALIETANVGIMLNALKPYPHAARVFGDIVENAAMRKSTQEKLASLAADKGKDWLKLTVSESAEEAAQSAADDLIHNAMVADKGERASNLKTYDASDILGRSAAAFAESLPGSAGFGLLGAGGGFAGGLGNISRQARRETRIAQTYGENAVKTMNGTIMLEQLQQAVASGKLKEKAPDVQQKILREQLAGSGYEMAYIDVETATQKETGMEDLKKVADAAGMTSEELETAVAENGFLAVPTEVLSQVSSSPDLLDSVSFSEEAESMARMRETNKQVLQSYEEAMKETIQRKADLIENLMKNTMPNATEEQRAMIEAAILTNPDNPAQGWNTLQKEMQGQLDEILAPALKALKEGMGKAGIMDVKDEIGNDKTVRYSENDAWYRNFYKQFKRQPTKAELEDMAIAMVTGDPSAPQVQGWIPDSQEMQEAMGENKAAINLLRNNIKALDEIKGEMQKLTGVEMELTAGLSPEAVSMYRQVYDWAKSVGGSTARQARMGAILAARHADIYAKKVTEKTGRKYTAVDYMREKLGFSIRPAGGGLNQLAGVHAETANMQSLRMAQEMDAAGAYADDIYKETGWLKGEDGKWRFEIPDNLDAMDWSVFEKGNPDNPTRLLKNIYDNPSLYEAYPWLKNIPVQIQDLDGGTYGGVGNADGSVFIAINKAAGDETKSGTLIHEIQHLIQDREGYAVGGTQETAWQQIRDRIKELSQDINQYELGERYAQTALDKEELFWADEKNEEAESLIDQEMEELEKQIPEEDREKIWRLASDREYLRNELNEHHKDDYFLYRNLAGEQEARHATERAIKHTNVVRAKNKLEDLKAKYEAEKAKQSPEMQEMLAELETLREKQEKTDADLGRMDEIKAAMDKDLQTAEMFYTWGKGTLEMREQEAAEMPKPHGMDGNALVVFGGQEMAAYASPETREEIFFQKAWHGSPYDFETFDLGAIGSGEGAQAHGWGLYFAGNREVSEHYKEVLGHGRGKSLYIDGKEHEWGTDDIQDKAMKALVTTLRNTGDVSAVRQKLEKMKQTETVKQAIKYIDEGRVKVDYPGKLFKVEIPDDDVLLDENKPFSEQPKKVQEALKKYAADMRGERLDGFISDIENEYGKDTAKTVRQYIEGTSDNEKDYTGWNPIDILLDSAGTQSPYQKLQALPDSESLIRRADRVKRWIGRNERDKANLLQAFENANSGGDIYRRLTEFHGNNARSASETLNDYGIKGIAYMGGRDGRCFVVFDDKAIDVIEKYNQQIARQQVQGQTSLLANGKRMISILETADESTFMHEMAHVFLYDLEELAQIDDVSAKELGIVNEWAEWHKGAAKDYKGTPWAGEFAKLEDEILDAEAYGDYERLEQKKRQWKQERFARAFEIYLRDGQAPAKGLKAVFRKFKQFLRQIYAAFTSDGARASEPVKRVMDRMIASEQEIEAAELEDRYADVTKAGGEKLLNESEEETYKRWYQEAEDEAKEKVLKIVMKDLERDKEEEFQRLVIKEETRKRKELQQENVYIAEQAVLVNGGDADIVLEWYPSVEAFQEELAVTPPLEEVLADHMAVFRDNLDADLIDSKLSPEAVDKVLNMSKYRNKMEALKGKAMAKKLALISRINNKAEKAMASIEEKLTALPEDMDLKVDAADPQVKSIMAEINKLRFASKWTSADLSHIEAMIRASTQEELRKSLKEFKEGKKQDKINEEEVLKANEGRMEALKTLAIEAMEGKPISDSCNVGYYVSQQKKAARRVRDMIKSKRWDMALQAQQQLGFYAAMVELAEKNKELRDKYLSQVKSEVNARSVRLPKDERYWHRHLAYVLRIAQTDAKRPESGVKSLDQLFTEMENSLDILERPSNVLEMAAREENFQGYQSLTLAELKEAVDSLHVIYSVGRGKFKMKTFSGKNILDVVREVIDAYSVANQIKVDTKKINEDRGGVAYSELVGNTGELGHLIAKRGQDYIISNLKPENITRMLGDAAHRYIYGTLERAAEDEAKLQAKNIMALKEIMSVYSHEERQSWKKKVYSFSTEGKQKISKEQIICMALNWGTKSNRQRLLGGLASDERTPEAVMRMEQEVRDLFKETMTAKDWQVVQKLWDHINSFWELTVEVEEKLNGMALHKIPADPFMIETKDGEILNLRGGYMEVKYDPRKSSRAGEQEANEVAQSVMAGAKIYGMGRGFTKARSEFDIYRPLRLDFGVIEAHLQNVIKNATFRVPVRDVYRIITSLDFENHVTEHLGREFHNVLKTWAEDAWKQVNDNRNTADNVLSAVFSKFRRSATMSIMGYRIWPCIENFSNISIAMGKIGAANMLSGVADFYGSPAKAMETVKQKSIFMRNRLENMDRDIRSQAGIFHAGNKIAEFARDHAYDLMVYSDLMVSAPLWLRSYKDAMDGSIRAVKEENEKNIKYVMQCQQELDAKRAEIGDLIQEAYDMEAHLHDRRYASPETAPMLRQSPFAVHSDENLRAMVGENRSKAKKLEKELWQAEVKFQEAQEIKILTDDEVLDEAERRAVFEADGVIRDTFGSGRAIDLPAIQRSRNELTKLLTTFYSFFNTQFNALYMEYVNGEYLPENKGIARWMPFARKVMYNLVLASMIGSTLAFGLGLQGGGEDDKKRKVKDAKGKDVEVEVPAMERFLKVWSKNMISMSVGSMYLIRDLVGVASDFIFNGKTYGFSPGSVASRSASEAGKMIELLAKKGQRDADIQAQQEKREQTHQEKLRKKKGKARQEYLKQWEEDQKYVKPPKRITYTEIAGHGLKAVSGFTAADTGLTSTLVNSITSTMQYLLDEDDRYDATMKNIIWSAVFDKRPVEREIPKKPEKPKKDKKKKN